MPRLMTPAAVAVKKHPGTPNVRTGLPASQAPGPADLVGDCLSSTECVCVWIVARKKQWHWDIRYNDSYI